MLRALAAKLNDTSFSAAVEELEVSLRELCGETGVQQRFGFLNGPHTRALDTALEQLRTRFGRPLIMKIVGVEPWSRLPERQYALIDFAPSTIPSP
jgi:DNA polymerase-4/protein ImuB